METNFPKKPESVICIVSGGLDSTVMLHEACELYSKVGAISFNYGSKHNAKEIPMAKNQCELLGVEHSVIELSFINDLFRSSLLSSGEEIPEGSYNETDMSSTVVPFRNGIMLSVAVGVAESLDAEAVLIGSHAGDHFIYPDCRPEFTEAFSDAASKGTDDKVRVYSPYAKLHKAEIVTRGRELVVDFSKTWTCYKGEDIHCGVCAACLERKTALGFKDGKDPTKYRN